MKLSLKILHLEDNKNDAELVREILQINDIDCEIINVDNKDDFLKNLKEKQWDIILADYNLPGFDGLEALSLAKTEVPEVPFIFISGVLGEELAIETLKQGATDYVIKSRLERLTPSVERAIKEKEEKDKRIELEREIIELEQLIGELQSTYNLLTRRVRGFVKIELPSGKYTVVDKFLEDLSGYPITKWKEKPFFILEICHPDFKENYQDYIDQMLDGIVPKLQEYKIISADGEDRWWLQFNIGAFDADGKLTSISAVIIDNTENKSAQMKYQNLFENALMGMYRTSIDTGEIIEANERMAKLFGCSSVEEFKMHRAQEFYYNEEDRENLINQLNKEGFYEEKILPFKRIDGTKIWLSESARILPDEGYMEGMLIDITDRKRAEDALKRDRAAFQIIAEAAIESQSLSELCDRILRGLVTTLDFDVGTIRLLNTSDNLLYLTAAAGLSDDDKEKLLPIAIDDQNHVGARVARTREAIFAPDIFNDESLKGVAPQLNNVRVRSNITYPILGGDGTLLGVLQLIAKTPKDIREEDRQLFETIADLFTSTLIQHQAINDLHDSEEKFRTFAEQSLIGVMILKISGEITFVNEELSNIFEYPIDEIYKNKFSAIIQKIFSEKDRLMIQEKTQKHIQDLTAVTAEYLVTSKSGKKKWISVYVAPITKEGQYIGSGIVVLDITEEKRALMTIERERQAFHLIAEATTSAKDIPDLCQRILYGLTDTLQYEIGTFRLFDEKTRLLDPIAVTMKDKSRIAEIKPISIDDQTFINTYVARTKEPVFAPDVTQNELTLKYIDRLDSYNARANITWPILNTNDDLVGTLQIVSNTPKELVEADKFFFETIVRFFSTALEMKKSDEALKQSEQKYRVLVETSPLVIALFDEKGKILVLNKHGVELFGAKDEKEILGRSFYSFLHEKEKERMNHLIKELFEKGSLKDIELTQVKLDGTEFISESWVSLIYDSQNKPIMSMAVMEDITDQKKIEKEQQRLYNIISNSKEVVISAKINGEIIYVNQAVQTVFGYSPEELIGKNISILAPEGHEQEQRGMIQSAIQGKKTTFDTFRKTKEGALIPVIIDVTSNRDEEGNIVSTNGMILDISGIKKSEEHFKGKIIQYKVLYKIASAGCQIEDLNQFLETTLEIITDDLEFFGGAVFLYDESTKKFKIRNAVGLYDKILNNINNLISNSKLYNKIFNEGKNLTSENISDKKDWLTKLEAKDFIFTPIFLGEKIQGAMVFLCNTEEIFGSDRIDYLNTIGNDLGVILKKYNKE